jgi:hypothetical protein
MIVQFVKDLFHQPVFIGALAVVTSICFYHLKHENPKYGKLVWIGYSSIFFFTFSIFFSSAIMRIYNPQVWDFTAFYLNGKVAAQGYNFYVPENFQTVLNTLEIPFQPAELGGFMNEVVNVGFPYPPPTILYFMPLGYLSFTSALFVWTMFNLIVVVACIYLIYDLFLKSYRLNGLFLVSILFFILGPSLSTISFSQTNFILLLLLLLMKKFEDKNISGLFLAIAFFTKPYMIIFGLFFLIRLKWKPILYCALSTIALVGITMLIVGKDPLISYIIDNPSKRIPSIMFYEEINQSLHSVLLRANLISLNDSLIFIFIAISTMILTIFHLLYLIKRRLYDYIWIILLLVGLLLYPGTLSYYGTLFLFIIFQFFDEKKQLEFNPILNISVIGMFFFLSTISVFSTILFLLGVIVTHSFVSQSRNNWVNKNVAPIQ